MCSQSILGKFETSMYSPKIAKISYFRDYSMPKRNPLQNKTNKNKNKQTDAAKRQATQPVLQCLPKACKIQVGLRNNFRLAGWDLGTLDTIEDLRTQIRRVHGVHG